jgi:outer membrane protein assembly factor BamA
MLAFCYGQSPHILKIISKEALSPQFIKLNYQRVDSMEVENLIKVQLENAKQSGFLLANMDIVIFKKDTVFVHVFLGEKYEQIQIFKGNVSSDVFENMGTKKSKKKSLFTHQGLKIGLNNIHNYYQNNGYPFASVKLDSIKNENNILSANILLNEGPIITYDSVDIGKYNGIKYRFLVNHLNLNYGNEYSNLEIDEVVYKVDELPYLKLADSPEVNFRLNKAQVVMDLESVQVNSFDGIAGFVPKQNGNGSQLTGELNLAFDNLFKSGKKINFEWQKLDSKSQYLDAIYFHPNLFYSPIDFSFRYKQLKEDTLFSNRIFDLMFGYQISNHVNLSIAYSNKNGNNLNSNKNQTGDFDINKYAIGFEINKLDNIRLPRNGFRTKFMMSVGSKTSSGSIIGSAKKNQSNQYDFFSETSWYKKLTKRSLIYAKVSGGYIENQQLFLNDLFRVGGLTTLRGFNEKMFFASKYGLLNVEWQMSISGGSYFLTFIDQGILKYDLENLEVEENPTGLGVGLKIKTKTGFFHLIYGLGRTSNQNFSFDFSKIHFGFNANL